MGRHSAAGAGSPDDGDRDDGIEYEQTDTGSWQVSHRRSGGQGRGVSGGLIGAIAAVVVVALAAGLWFYFDKVKTDRSAEAAGTCVHGKNNISVVADPSIADRIGSLASRFNDRHEVIGDFCFTVAVHPAESANVIKGLTGTWPGELGDQPALWIPGSSVSTARLVAAAKSKIVSDSRSLVTTPVVIAVSPKLRQALPPQQSWADVPGLQDNPNSLDALGLTGWGSLRLALPVSGNADAPLLAEEAVAAASVHPGDSPELGSGAAAALVSGAPKPPINSVGDALGVLLDASDPAVGPVHAVVTTQQQLYARTHANPDSKKVVAEWRPAGDTPVADYPMVELHGSWISDEQRSAASQFAHFLDEPDQLKELASDGFLAEGAGSPSSDVVSFGKIDKPLTLDDKTRVALANGTSATTTIMLDSSLGSVAPDVRLSDVTTALANRVKAIPPTSAVGLWVYDGKEGDTVVRLGAASDDVEGVPRSQSIADAVNALKPTSGAVAYTTLRNVYQDAVEGFRPDQVNSVLIIAGPSHTDQSLDGPGVIDTVNKLKDPAKPVRINVIDFGADSDQQTWQALAQQTGGSYLNLPSSGTPDVAAAFTRFLQ